jgi:hypothetical protein
MEQPALVIGHHADPLHPFSDSGSLAKELRHARLVEATSILEWRIRPERLDDELAAFLDDVWGGRRGLTSIFRRDSEDGQREATESEPTESR